MKAVAVPPLLEEFSGQILDADSHEAMPAQEWVRHFGVEVQAFAAASAHADLEDKNHSGAPDYVGDVVPIDEDIGLKKGPTAPGATDPQRRLDVMDAMGVNRQLMFPGGIGLFGFFLYLGKRPALLEPRAGDEQAMGRRWLELYETWMVDVAKLSDRIRPVMPIYGETPTDLIANTERLIDKGVRVFWMASGFPPGGRSPAHPDLDPLWALMAQNNAVLTLHGGGEGELFKTREWRNAPAFDGYRATAEFDFDPWSMSIYHLPSQNFVTTMVMGGVFDRHPGLRMGVIELGSQWVGPTMDALDELHRNFRVRMSRKPSEIIRSNVRVSPLYYEPIDVWIERYEGLDDVLCFGSDYPHVEGGKNAMSLYASRLARLGPEVLRKFFVSNGAFLLP